MLNSCPPSAAYMRYLTRSALIQIKACRLFGARPLSAPIMAYCQLNSWEQISVIFESEFYNFHSTKCIWKCRLQRWQLFCPGGDVLSRHCKCAWNDDVKSMRYRSCTRVDAYTTNLNQSTRTSTNQPESIMWLANRLLKNPCSVDKSHWEIK